MTLEEQVIQCAIDNGYDGNAFSPHNTITKVKKILKSI